MPLRPATRSLVAALLTTLACSGPLPLAASDFDDFRVPDHTWYTLSSELGGSWMNDRRVDVQRWLRTQSAIGNLGVRGTWAVDGDDHSFRIDALGGGIYGWSDFINQESYTGLSGTTPITIDSDVRGRDVNSTTQWLLAVEARRYPFEVPLGWMLRASGAFNQNWRHSTSTLNWSYVDSTGRVRNMTGDEADAQTSGLTLDADAALGWGQVRDATGVYEAYLLERRLREHGVIRRRLPESARIQLANLYTVRPRLGAAHDRPDRFFWREVERILEESGRLDRRNWDAFEIVRAEEPYTPGRMQRQRGFFVGPSIGLASRQVGGHIDQLHQGQTFLNDAPVSAFEYTISNEVHDSGNRIVPGLLAEYHMPFGMRWQVDASSRATSPTRDFAETFHVASQGSVWYGIADRWSLTGFVAHQCDVDVREPALLVDPNAPLPPPGSVPNSWTLNWGGALAFYIEDRTTLSLELRDSRGKFDDPRVGPEFHTSFVRLSIGYRFLGTVDAPGVFEPMHLLSLDGTE